MTVNFATSGLISEPWAYGKNGVITGIVNEPDGKYVAWGFIALNNGIDRTIQLSRYNSDGTIDTSFSSGGNLTFPQIYGNFNDVRGATAQSDGKLLVIFRSQDTTKGTATNLVARINADGSFDSTFGNNGFSTISSGTTLGDFYENISVASDGKILATGAAADSLGWTYIALTRLNSNGTIDSSFGSNGTSKLQPTSTFGNMGARGLTVTQQNDGKYIVGGLEATGNPARAIISLTRFNNDGSIDTTYGSSGYASLDLGGDFETIIKDIVLPDGKLLILASATYLNIPNVPNNNVSHTYLARINKDGSLDTTFGVNGRTEIVNSETWVGKESGLAIDNSGMILVTGSNGWHQTGHLTGQYFSVMRFGGNGSIDTSFGNNGQALIFNTDPPNTGYNPANITYTGTYGNAYSLTQLQNGSYLVSGSLMPAVITDGGNHFLLARLTNSGSIDGDGVGMGGGSSTVSTTSSPPFTSNPSSNSSPAWLTDPQQKNTQKLYLAYFGRPADSTGVIGVEKVLNSSGGNPDAVTSPFSNSAESKAFYANKTLSQQVNTVYNQLFNRNAEQTGLDYWVNLLNKGAISNVNMAIQILNGAQANDLSTVNNRIAVATYFTEKIPAANYTGLTAASNARKLLSAIGSDPNDVTKAEAAIDSTLFQAHLSSDVSTDITLTGLKISQFYTG